MNSTFPDRGFYVGDVGAYTGWYTTIASKLSGSGLVHSFEPEPNNFKVLKKTVQFSKLKNVLLLRLALSDKDGIEHLSISRNQPNIP
ncbi:MAG: FkbM family methyltransferase [Nitrososphaerales archaeon]